ncbi:MAG: tRNA pseudouridine(13) synthase TruD [Methylococcales bacterium]|nr:tRNA pseudouridine(13) synthase TruD [Methylococcales bacterium]
MSNEPTIEIPTWAYAYANAGSIGKIKTIPADFIVEEQLPFHPEGEGEHAFVQIEKSGENTEYIARLLARFAGVRQRDVSFAGLKDRHAITSQWFSIWLPGKDDPDWKQIETDNIKILQSVRHARKLKRGVLSGNQFQIVIRDWQGNREVMEDQLQLIKKQGIPNYFGGQRFGLKGQNVNKALALFKGVKVKRELRSIYLSAVRSYIFNQLLSERVLAGNWNQGVCGDVLIFDQSNSYFKTGKLDTAVLERIKAGEVHPTGLMAGKGSAETVSDALALEDSILSAHQTLVDGLVKFDLKADRRALRVFAKDIRWEFKQDSKVLLKFFLPAGGYATSLLRELLHSG